MARVFPCEIHWNDWPGLLFKGHDIPEHILRARMDQYDGDPESDVVITEEWLCHYRRVKWCSNYDGGCDNEGDWHSHWTQSILRIPENAYTVVTRERGY